MDHKYLKSLRQKKLAQASQDLEDVQDRVNADDELIKFLEKGMHEKMTKHGELAVKSFNLRQSLSDSGKERIISLYCIGFPKIEPRVKGQCQTRFLNSMYK